MFETFLKKSEEKWVALHQLEKKIKQATKKKFQELKQTIKSELKQEIIEVLGSVEPQQAHLENCSTKKIELKNEILEVVRTEQPPEVTPEDLQNVRDEVMSKMQTQNKETLEKVLPNGRPATENNQ